jgi:alanyl-tRNA synthetase
VPPQSSTEKSSLPIVKTRTVLAAVSGNKVSLVAGVTKDLTDKYQAGKILNHVAQQVGGKGGGRPDMAQGGGTESSKVDEALASVKGLI